MRIRLLTVILFGSGNLYTLPGMAEEEYLRPPGKPPLEARVEIQGKAGTDRSIAVTEFWVPIAQNVLDGSVVYGDLRVMGDDVDNQEFNLGVGYRKMIDHALLGAGIVGGHVWYDKRLTDRGSSFNQVTFGGEWFSDLWDAKVNAYIPLNIHGKSYLGVNPNGVGTTGFSGN